MKGTARQRSASGVPSPGVSPESSARTEPIRTCVGCRRRAGWAELLRVVAVQVDGGYVVRPDPRYRLPGRGAWLHRDLSCLEQAQRRRAFGRALRVTVPIDLAELREHLEDAETTGRTPIGCTPDHSRRPRGGGSTMTESGFDADEYPMSPQQ